MALRPRFGLARLSAAATVALLNMSLVLALGALVAAPLGRDALSTAVVAAFVAVTLGGFIVAVVARAPGDVTGLASSTTVIYAALGADLAARAGSQVNLPQVWAALSLAVVIMGILVAAAGWLRLAEAVKFIPAPVSAGFVTGIGLLVIWSQLGPLLGLEGRLSGYDWSRLVHEIKPASLAVGLATAAVIWGYAKVVKWGQPALAAVVIGTSLHYLIQWLAGPEHLGPTLGAIAPAAMAGVTVAMWGQVSLPWLLSTAVYVFPYAAFLALQSIMNGAVTSVALASITGERSDINRTLKAQGLVNILCGGFGALPITTVTTLSLSAARLKGMGPGVVPVACIILVVAVLVAGDLLARIPVAVLAGILVMGGAGMIDAWARGLVRRVVRGQGTDIHTVWNLLTVAAVAAAFFFGSVPLALFVGAVLAMILLVMNLASATTFGSQDAANLQSTRVWSSEQVQWLQPRRASVRIFRPRGGLFFGTADQLATQLAALGPETRYCVLDLARLTTLDATGSQILAAGARKLAAAGIVTVVAGLDASRPREQALIALGLNAPDPASHWFADLDHALEWIETRIVKERWPELSPETEVRLAETPLGRGLSAAEIDELQPFLACREVEAGPLFVRGDPGSAMYVIDQGSVEIRVRDRESGNSTRLAAFGPGGIFGEIAMLTSEQRTADAVCVTPTRLHELRREGLRELAERSPRLYAKILENLNLHLADRLVIATGIVRAQQ